MKTSIEKFTPAPGTVLVRKIMVPQRETYKDSDLKISNRSVTPETFQQLLREWDEFPFVGKVVKVGKTVKDNSGNMVDLSWIEEGDVVFSKSDIPALKGVLLNGQPYFYLYSSDIFGKGVDYDVKEEEYFNGK